MQQILLRAINSDKYYTPQDINTVLSMIGDIEFINTNKKIEYANIPCSFDIESTSFYQSNELDLKVAIMYEWTLNLSGYTIIGRFWDDFIETLSAISEYYSLHSQKHLIIYVHNLGYDFQFIRKRISWESVFALDDREPVKAVSEYGIEFRCSYKLSGYSLSNLSKQLTKYKCRKMDGDLDYSILRNSLTPLTKQELQYCINDCMVVVCYIQELIERLGDITKIPLTKTGFVRKYCRDSCLYDGKTHSNNIDKFNKYRNLMRSLTLDAFTYNQLKKAFQGGFTHCSALYSGDIIYNVDSFDFISSYPFVIVSEQFPMSKGEKYIIKNEEDFKNNLLTYCCVFDIEFFDLEPITIYENYISKSKCTELEDIQENNGRIVSAKHLKTTITEQDYFIIRKMYKWSKMKINNFIRFRKNYLPRDFVLAILKFYKDKTELKGIDEKIVEYSVAKENVNSCYGMMVTDICRDEIVYNDTDDWDKVKADIDKCIETYNKSVKRFLFYAWGIWVTAYARRNLFTGIFEFKDDYIYSDTDSIKVRNVSNHLDYIKEYNKAVRNKLEKAMEYHKIPIEMTRPKNKYGVEKELGIWEWETKDFKYTKFKSLGAKRYMLEQNNKIKLTVSGLNKNIATPYLQKTYGEKIFDKFSENLYIPPKYTGKMTHTYIDEEREGYLKDYKGNIQYYHELSSVHLENADYTLSLNDAYVKYLLGVKLKEK